MIPTDKRSVIVFVGVVVASILWVALCVVLWGGCANESIPRMKMFEAMKGACDGDNDCVGRAVGTSFPSSDCCTPCREKYGRRHAKRCRVKCIELQRELIANGAEFAGLRETDWNVIWEKEQLEE